MKEIKKQLALLKKLSRDISLSDQRLIELEKFKTMLENATPEEQQYGAGELWKTLDGNLDFLEQSIKAYASRQNAPKITIGDKTYDLKEYCTISQYAKLFNYPSTMPITNQIRRKKISPDRVVFIPDLGIKLIRLI